MSDTYKLSVNSLLKSESTPIRVHDNLLKDTSSNTTISLQRQLVYYDSLSNATLSLLLFLPTTFGRKNIKA